MFYKKMIIIELNFKYNDKLLNVKYLLLIFDFFF